VEQAQWPDNSTVPDACNSIFITSNYSGTVAFVSAVNITLSPTGAPGCPVPLTGGQIAGIVIGSVAGAALLAVGLYLLITKVIMDPGRTMFSSSSVPS
jgi:hypothetical protein